MPFSPKNVEEKPYNMCLNCIHIGKNCDGPNFLSMEMEDLSKWCKLRKDYLRNHDPIWTNSYIAERASISKVSVDRFIAGNVVDLKMSTIAAILKVLVNGSWGQYPCAMAMASETEIVYMDNPKMAAELEYERQRCAKILGDLNAMREEYRKDLSIYNQREVKNSEHFKKQISFMESIIEKKDKMLEEQYLTIRRKNKFIKLFCIIAAVAVLSIVALLIVWGIGADIGAFK